jgi:Rrf2 family protein
MKFTTKTEYAVVCLVSLARNSSGTSLSIRDMVKTEKVPMSFLEKIFQKMRKAGIVTSQKGKRGGYALSRKPSKITLKEIIETVEGSTFDTFCEPSIRKGLGCKHFSLCGIRPIWNEAKKILDDYFASITLEKLAEGAVR